MEEHSRPREQSGIGHGSLAIRGIGNSSEGGSFLSEAEAST